MPNLYVNPALNAPLGPDGLPIQVDANFVQQDYEVCFRTSCHRVRSRLCQAVYDS